MAVKLYAGDTNGIAREIKKLYVGDSSGIAREVKNLYVGDTNGTARKIYEQQKAGKWEISNKTGISSLLVYGAGIFLSTRGSSSRTFYYSTDGINWDNSYYISELSTTDHVTSLSYVNNTFWATFATNNGGSANTGDRRLGRSSDGINWTISKSALPANSVRWIDMAYGNGTYVMISYNTNVSGTSQFAYSTDNGITWKSKATPMAALWRDIAYGAGKFVVLMKGLNDTNTNQYIYSTDGINWTKGTMPATAAWKRIIYANGAFYAIPYGGIQYIYYSIDGINWTARQLPVLKYWGTLLYGDGEFIMAGSKSNVAVHSKDGINWTQSEIPTTANWNGNAYGNGRFVFTAQNVAAVYSK